MAFLQHVLIDCSGDPKLFKDVAEQWQWLLISRVIPAIEAVAGVRSQDYKGPRSFWFTLPRGHDKTSLIGRLCGWCLAFSRRPLRMVAAAADRDQASFILDFMQTEARLNTWMTDLLRFANWQVSGMQGSRLKVLSADDKSSYGLKEDIMVLDELTHWPKRGLWDTIISGREKRPGSVLFVITNAGLYNTWQREVYEVARKSPDWYVYEAPGQLAGWMSRDKINELRKTLPAPLGRRLFDNAWIDPGEECGFVTREEARECVNTLLTNKEAGEPGNHYVMSVDYAPVRDRTVMCVGHEKDGKVILDRMDMIQGSHTNRVQVATVERWIDEMRQKFFNPTLLCDPYQMEGTLQKYEGTLNCVRFEARGGKANYELASTLRNLIINKRIEWFPAAGELIVDGRSEDLVDELSSILLKTTSYGYRIDHESNKHDDRVVAMGQLCVELIKNSGFISIPTDSRWF